MSEIARESSHKNEPIPSPLPYEIGSDSSLDDSLMDKTLDDTVFEPNTEDELKNAISESGKRFEFGSGLANVKTDVLQLKPVSYKLA